MIVTEVVQREKIYALYCKPDQNTMNEGVIGPMKMFKDVVFLNGYCIKLFLNLYVYTYRQVLFSPLII